jgi:hypothetical protein
MIEKVVEAWHRFVAGELPEGLHGLLADDVVFYSPIVYTPQRGKAVMTMYLHAVAQTVPGDPVHGVAGDVGMLEFETTGSTSSAAMTPGASWSCG